MVKQKVVRHPDGRKVKIIEVRHPDGRKVKIIEVRHPDGRKVKIIEDSFGENTDCPTIGSGEK